MTQEKVFENLQAVRDSAPLVHNITNYVAMNFSANVLLSLGASPIMAHAEEEVEAMVRLSGALVLNIGTLTEAWVRSMKRALACARECGRIAVLDPVGAGATAYRTRTALALLEEGGVGAIRGNAFEILALAGGRGRGKGVDSLSPAEAALEAAQSLARTYRAVVCVSGATDYVVDRENVIALRNGHPWMAKVTAMGCAATAVVGAFAAVEADLAQAMLSGMAVMSLAGEIAAENAQGPGSFQTHFLDGIANLSERDFARLKLDRQ